MRTHRVRRSYDHRLRDAIAATGNADLFRNVAIPASTRRTWARSEIRPVVASVDVELSVYELLEQVESLRQRAKVQAAIIGLLVRVLRALLLSLDERYLGSTTKFRQQALNITPGAHIVTRSRR